MNSNTVLRAFRSPLGALPRAAGRLLGALNDPTIGPPVTAHLPATFVADFAAQIDLVEQRGADQVNALGTLRTLTRTQAAAREEVLRLSPLARRAAKLAFPGQHPLLHDAFQLGQPAPTNLSSVLERSRRQLAACLSHPDELAAHGWSAASTTAFSAAIDALAGVDQTQKTAADTSHGITDHRISGANTLFKQCLLVQNAARIVYTGASIDRDPAAIEARARYLLGEFPSRPGAAANPAPVPAAAPAPATHPLAA